MIEAPQLKVRMRCPACWYEAIIEVEPDFDAGYLPEVMKQAVRCKCANHIPKVNLNTPLEKSIVSINGIPFQILLERELARNDTKIIIR